MQPVPRVKPELTLKYAKWIPHWDGPALSAEDLRLLIKTLRRRELAHDRQKRRAVDANRVKKNV